MPAFAAARALRHRRLTPARETGTPAEDFVIFDINQDGNRDIQLRFSTQQLIDDGHLDPNTTEITVWGLDPTTGDLYAGSAEVEILEPQRRTLSTDVPNNTSGGVFIDLTSDIPARFVAFDVAYTGTVGTTVEVEVWTRPGSYVGFDDDPSGWTLTQTIEGTRLGSAVLSPHELDVPIDLTPGETVAVYLHAITPGGGIRYNRTAANPPQTTWSNDDLTLFGDVARTGATPFGGTRFTPRTFAGNVHYEVD